MSVYKFNNNKTPGAQPRKGEGKMDAEDVQRVIKGLIDDAEHFVDGELSPDRAKATDYYFARPFGNEDDGRSQVVMSEVRDTIHGMLPSLLRKFFGPERAVELVARTPNGVKGAQQATDYVQYVFAEDNAGFLRSYDVLKDGLTRRLGVFKYWWDATSHRAYHDADLDDEGLIALVSRDDVEPTAIKENKDGTFDVDYTVTIQGGPVVVSVPPEEFLFNAGARNLDEAVFVAHRTEKTRGDLIAMGYDEDDIDEHMGSGAFRDNVEAIGRRPTTGTPRDTDAGEANDKILYIESYPYLDCDGDGEAELRKVCTIGTDHFVVHNELADDRPFALFCPIPEPHTLVGQSEADLTMDIQLVKSSLVRSTLDSLALSIYPRMAFIEGQASVEDLLNNAIGAPIRTKRENAVQSFTHAFTGKEALPILDYFDTVKEARVGRASGSTGLDSDALQSSTPGAVGAAVNAAAEQMDLVARMFAEQTLKPLFRGIYRLLVKHRPKERLVRLRGVYIPIDTVAWEADMDCTVNVAIGMSDTTNKLTALMGIAAKQEMTLQELGPMNPLCHMSQLRETYARMTELSGFRDVAAFWNEVPADWQPPPQEPVKTPEQTIAEAQLKIEEMRTKKDLEIKQAELTLKSEKQSFEQEFEIRKMANEFVLRRYEIDAKYKVDHSQEQLDRDLAAEQAELEGVMEGHRLIHGQAMAEQAQNHKQQLAEQAQEHEQELARLAQDHDQMIARQTAARPEGAE